MAGKQSVGKTKYTNQTIQNFGFDETFEIPIRLPYVYNRATGAVEVKEDEQLVVTKVDEASSTTTYLGRAACGTATSAASWQIRKISESGNVTTIEWADGDRKFDNVWDDRASLSYS